MKERGPKIGDAISLWNFAPSPGFTKEDVGILKIALMALGVGRWVQILDTGLLPGKMIQQLNCQTQRLLGQQSLAAFTGLSVDIDRIREDNSKREGERKGGLLINSGPNPNKELRKKWQEESKAKYGLTKEQIRTFKDQLEDLKKVKQSEKMEQVLSYSLQLDSMGKPELVELLKKLRGNLKILTKDLVLSEAAPEPAVASVPEVSTKTSSTPKKSRSTKRKASAKEISISAEKENVETDALQSIVAMGFKKAMALDALQENNYVLQDAVDWLMRNVS